MCKNIRKQCYSNPIRKWIYVEIPSNFTLENAQTVQHTHRIHWYHTLDTFFALLCFIRLLFWPYNHESLIKSCIPVVTVCDYCACSFSLHHQTVNQIFEGPLKLYKFSHYCFIDLIDPLGDLEFIIDSGSKDCIYGLEDHFITIFYWKTYFFHLLRHLWCVGMDKFFKLWNYFGKTYA